MQLGHSQDQTTNNCADDVYLLVNNVARCEHQHSDILPALEVMQAFTPAWTRLPSLASPAGSHRRLSLMNSPPPARLARPGIAETRGLAASLVRPRAAACEFAGCLTLPRGCSESEGSKFGCKWSGVFISSLCKGKRINPLLKHVSFPHQRAAKQTPGKPPWLEASHGW